MALEIVKLSAGGQGPQHKVDRHLYLTKDKDRVVEEGDPASRWLWATPGQMVPLAEAERLGAVKPDSEAESVDDDAEQADAPAKRRTPAQNKQRKPRENKSTKDETEAPPAEEE
jgi:hypothetical protein